MPTQPLRGALGRYTTGVTIVTCCDADGAFVGLTVNSFNSLSLEPALVLWSLRKASPSAGIFCAAPRFAVNVLAQGQLGLARRFAVRGDHRFGEGVWTLGEHGAPLLDGCAAAFQCETASQQRAGDHVLFIGRVLAHTDADLPPLAFQGGRYHALGEVL
ncbi:MAG: flavin reductase family protein [Rubrivivax sp.]|nr:flavin reductase family protein [Rubrivivax sp.]